MPRIKSTTAVGVSPRDTRVDSSIYARWLRAAVGDVALASDLVTGQNSTTPVNHTGSPNGARIHLPLAFQHIGRDLTPSAAGEYAILAVPVFVRTGEAGSYNLDIIRGSAIGRTVPVSLEVRNTSWSVTEGPITVDWVGDYIGFEDFSLQNGLQYILVKTILYPETVTLKSWTLAKDHSRWRLNLAGSFPPGDPSVPDRYNGPSAYSPANIVEFYDEEVQEDGPLSAFVVSRLNHKINSLWEYVTGAPVPGNRTRNTGTNYWLNNRSVFSNEALLQWPITTLALGASSDFLSPGKNPSSSQLQSWIRYPTTHFGTAQPFTGFICDMPNFRTSTSDLRAVVLMEAPSANSLAAWRFDAKENALAAATAVAPTQIGTTNYWVATITGIPFSPGAVNRMDLRMYHSAGGGGAVTSHVQILGACMFFLPP